MYCVSSQILLIVAVLLFTQPKFSNATFEVIDRIKGDDVNVRDDFVSSPIMESQSKSVDASSTMKSTTSHDEDDRRELVLSGSVPCNGGAGPINFFTINFRLTPQGGWDLSGCTSSAKKGLGDALNAFLLDYGIGSAGKGDNIAFVGQVCNVPKVVNARLRERNRELAVLNFIYSGGGPCRFCSNDNFDARRARGLLRERILQTDPNWFQNVFKPEMQNTLRNAFTQTVAPRHKACLGNGPTVDPIITKISDLPKISC